MRMTIDTKQYHKRSAKYRNMDRAIIFQLTRWGGQTIKKIKMNIRSIFRIRTGHLWRNVAYMVNPTNPSVTIGSGVPPAKEVKYAHIQEKGGTVRAKNVKYLTIPFPGVKGRARNFPDSFVLKSKAGNLIIAERKGKSGIRPLFTLKKEVTLPAQHWLSDSINEMSPLLYKLLSPAELLRVMDKGV